MARFLLGISWLYVFAPTLFTLQDEAYYGEFYQMWPTLLLM